MLTRELSQFSETSRSGNQVAEWVTNTYFERGEDELELEKSKVSSDSFTFYLWPCANIAHPWLNGVTNICHHYVGILWIDWSWISCRLEYIGVVFNIQLIKSWQQLLFDNTSLVLEYNFTCFSESNSRDLRQKNNTSSSTSPQRKCSKIWRGGEFFSRDWNFTIEIELAELQFSIQQFRCVPKPCWRLYKTLVNLFFLVLKRIFWWSRYYFSPGWRWRCDGYDAESDKYLEFRPVQICRNQ